MVDLDSFRLRIAKKNHLYNLTENIHRLDEEEDSSDSWKREPNENVDKLKRSFNLDFPPVELPYPFNFAKLFLSREDSCFSAYIMITSRDLFVYNNLSKRLEDSFSKTGLLFHPTTQLGTGYLIDRKGNIRLSVMDAGPDCVMRDLGIGCNGARTRNFNDFRSFRHGLLELEKATTTFLTAAYDPFCKLNYTSLPSSVVYLNP